MPRDWRLLVPKHLRKKYPHPNNMVLRMKKSPDPKQFLNDADLRLERARNGWIVELSGSYLPEGKTDENKDSKYGTIKWIHLSQEAAIAQLTEIAEMLGLDE